MRARLAQMSVRTEQARALLGYTVAELDKSKDDQPDVMLDQAAQIMTDVVTGVRAAPAQKTARAG